MWWTRMLVHISFKCRFHRKILNPLKLQVKLASIRNIANTNNRVAYSGGPWEVASASFSSFWSFLAVCQTDTQPLLICPLPLIDDGQEQEDEEHRCEDEGTPVPGDSIGKRQTKRSPGRARLGTVLLQNQVDIRGEYAKSFNRTQAAAFCRHVSLKKEHT